MTTKKQLAEEQMRHEDLLDVRLFEALEVMDQPTKWGMNREGNFTELFPYPVFEGNRVKAVEYRTTKAVELPEELLERLCILEDKIEALNEAKDKTVLKANKALQGRPSKFSPEDVAKMLEMREQGATYGEVAGIVGASATTVSNYLKKYIRKQKEAKKQAEGTARNAEVEAEKQARQAKKERLRAEKQAKEAEKQARQAEKERFEALRAGRMIKQMKAQELMYTWAEEYKAGASSIQIAEKYGLSDQTVRNYLKKLGVM